MMEREEDMRPSRRRVVLGGLGIAMTGTPWLTACANRPPPPPPKPVSLLAILPVAVAPVSAKNTGFGAGYTYVSTPGVPLGPALAGGLIAGVLVYAIESKRQKDRAALQQALAQVAFDPAAAVQRRIAPALEERNVRTVAITDPSLVAAIRDGRVEGLPDGVDAILDMGVDECGYYESTRAGGFSPMLNLWASVRAATPGADELDSFSYYADWRDAGKELRWVTTPKSTTYATAEELGQHGAQARAGLEDVTEKLVAMMADDLQRHAQGQRRID
jgi:hypothetical protein